MMPTKEQIKQINKVLKQIPIDQKYCIKTKHGTDSGTGRFRPDFENDEFLFFENANKQIIKYKRNEIVWIAGGDAKICKLEEEIHNIMNPCFRILNKNDRVLQ